jgi:hypothetical protein
MENFIDSDNDTKSKESRAEYKRRRDREINDLQSVLKKPEGRRFVYKMLSECGVFRASFSLNSMQTAFNEGKRDIGLALLRELDEAEPHAYTQMLTEHFSELKSKKLKDKTEDL